MARINTQEERLLLKLIEKLPLPVEDKNGWSERIRNGEMSAELAEEIRVKLAAPVEGDANPAVRARHLAELANLVRRWRLSSQSHHFSRK
mgnify:CR=1 FL=1